MTKEDRTILKELIASVNDILTEFQKFTALQIVMIKYFQKLMDEE